MRLHVRLYALATQSRQTRRRDCPEEAAFRSCNGLAHTAHAISPRGCPCAIGPSTDGVLARPCELRLNARTLPGPQIAHRLHAMDETPGSHPKDRAFARRTAAGVGLHQVREVTRIPHALICWCRPPGAGDPHSPVGNVSGGDTEAPHPAGRKEGRKETRAGSCATVIGSPGDRELAGTAISRAGLTCLTPWRLNSTDMYAPEDGRSFQRRPGSERTLGLHGVIAMEYR